MTLAWGLPASRPNGVRRERMNPRLWVPILGMAAWLGVFSAFQFFYVVVIGVPAALPEGAVIALSAVLLGVFLSCGTG
jgi:hypothetical protein